jgi:hypothetical protein
MIYSTSIGGFNLQAHNMHKILIVWFCESILTLIILPFPLTGCSCSLFLQDLIAFNILSLLVEVYGFQCSRVFWIITSCNFINGSQQFGGNGFKLIYIIKTFIKMYLFHSYLFKNWIDKSVILNVSMHYAIMQWKLHSSPYREDQCSGLTCVQELSGLNLSRNTNYS